MNEQASNLIAKMGQSPRPRNFPKTHNKSRSTNFKKMSPEVISSAASSGGAKSDDDDEVVQKKGIKLANRLTSVMNDTKLSTPNNSDSKKLQDSVQNAVLFSYHAS